MNELGDAPGSVAGINFTIKNVMLALDELKQELAKWEARMIMSGDTYADIKKDIERFNSRREDITQNMA